MKKLVAITGASSGIGKALAYKFAKEGHPVLLMARRVEILEKFDIKDKVCAKVDVQNIDEIKNAIKLAEKKYGPVDCMINNAGIMFLNLFHEQPLQHKYDMLDVNVKGVINGIDAVLNDMLKRKDGTIINISSIGGRWIFRNHAIYNGSKFAVNAITEGVRKEVAGSNVRFSSVEPGMVNTDILSRTDDKEILKDYNDEKWSIGGGLTTDNTADLCYYIYSLPQMVNIKEVVITHTNDGN
ncbi:SDR family oxidoreductase [Spiroplasma endosymbiont of Anurida maritima]|uniref:SDR family oxidoreductase n=1 Tax=Spiroplasma endosymbiont of Anurida maritima TaxID=2967972 RepID=UPI0036D2F5A0